MNTVTIDAAVIEKVKASLDELIKKCSLYGGPKGGKMDLSQHKEALSLLESAQSQPGVGDEARKTALDELRSLDQNCTDAFDELPGVQYDCACFVRDHAETIRAAISAPAVQEWQTIESAPRDGTQFLATRFKPSIQRFEYRILRFVEGTEGWIEPDYIWETETESGRVDRYTSDWPTHWQPLPPPPRAVADKTQGEGL